MSFRIAWVARAFTGEKPDDAAAFLSMDKNIFREEEEDYGAREYFLKLGFLERRDPIFLRVLEFDVYTNTNAVFSPRQKLGTSSASSPLFPISPRLNRRGICRLTMSYVRNFLMDFVAWLAIVARTFASDSRELSSFISESCLSHSRVWGRPSAEG